MQPLLCATGNKSKFDIAKIILATHGIELEQVTPEINEIQGENPGQIIRDKVRKAYEQLRRPVTVSDDSWDIPGLRGFPGPYMKSLNQWFTPEDFIRLTHGLTDRRIFLHQFIAYQNEHETIIFHSTIPGIIATTARGHNGDPAMKVTILDCDNGRTISEVYDAGQEHAESRLHHRDDPWEQLAAWYMQPG